MKCVYFLLDLRKPCKLELANVCFLFTPFYVGEGNLNRWKGHFTEKENNRKNKILRKLILLNYKRTDIKFIYATDLLSEDAFKLEISFIAELKRMDDGGILSNITPGGNCGNLSSRSDDWKKNHSNLMSGIYNPAYKKLPTKWIINQDTDEIFEVNNENRLEICNLLKIKPETMLKLLQKTKLYFKSFFVIDTYPSHELIDIKKIELANKIISDKTTRSVASSLANAKSSSEQYFTYHVDLVFINIENRSHHIIYAGHKIFYSNNNLNKQEVLSIINKKHKILRGYTVILLSEFIDVNVAIDVAVSRSNINQSSRVGELNGRAKKIKFTNLLSGQVVTSFGNLKEIKQQYGIKDNFKLTENGSFINSQQWIRVIYE